MRNERLIGPKLKPAEIDELRQAQSQKRPSSQQEKDNRPNTSVRGVDLPLPSQGKELGEQMGK